MKKILVIEDNFEVRENLAEILELADYEVYTAENGKTGIRKINQVQPDLIICDIMMPELDGFGVLKIVENNPRVQHIPFIFLTAKAEKLDFRKGMNLGADDYITKPFDDSELLDAIEIRLRKSERSSKKIDETLHGWQHIEDAAEARKLLERLSEKSETRSYRKKELIYQEDELPLYLYFVISGQVKCFKTNEAGKELILDIYKEGNFFGHQALLSGAEYTESAMAMEASKVGLVRKEDFFALLYHNRAFAAQFIKILADDSIEKEEQLLSLAYNSIRKRVAESLLKLYQQSGADDFSILREDLAAMVGTAKESAIRVLTDFKHEGIIKIENGKIIILHADRLVYVQG